jgi:hypothetical protein
VLRGWLRLLFAAQAHEAAQAAAEASFYEHLLGRRQAGSLKEQLAAAIAKEHKAKVTANIAESNTLCQALEMECTKQLAVGDSMLQVPSMYQFEGRHKACTKRFEVSNGSSAVLQAFCALYTVNPRGKLVAAIHHDLDMEQWAAGVSCLLCWLCA